MRKEEMRERGKRKERGRGEVKVVALEFRGNLRLGGADGCLV